ncbi:filamentous hemagglutinin family N-terminal domain protein [Rivularia sp. PCC 7116]|uniref:two-partner secretion domain-containing protein n=1 Tax=Rivularia sp. PCC 7116 TaxID=373994 RepID=UPI00029F474D|nr:filamentous hemagglutinin N-terminal domain-containing protein [Rivularia sp. PCC 7116]AFY58691.1 filamentous hemagglutinin family N-terminal domain protein [Rivularia sp. PCC 7116]
MNLSCRYKKQLSYITCLLLLFPSFTAKSVNAQLIRDRSLGVESSKVKSSVDRDLIEGGAIRDNNLFHSFQEFNVNPNQKVYFSNPDNITNILTRVTGNNISRILGTLGVDGNANLFLINPNGIVFGENAFLDIKGSFVASSGNGIVFDNYNFNTLNPKSPPLLTINLPLGIQLGSNPGEIEVQGKGHYLTTAPPFSLQLERSDRSTGLRVNPGNTLALIGGNVNLSGGVLTAESGKIELAAVNEGVVGINNNIRGWEFDYSRVENFGDIQLIEKSLADVSGVGSGFVEVRAQNLRMSDGSVLWTQNLGDAVSGDIIVNVGDSLLVEGTTPDAAIRTGIFSEALGGNGGNVKVDAKKVTVLAGGSIAAYTYGKYSGGNVDINASESILVDGISTLNPVIISAIAASNFSEGKAGINTVSTKELTISNGGMIVSATLGSGEPGLVKVKANDILLDGRSPITFSGGGLITNSIGEETSAADLVVDTATLRLENGGIVSSSTQSSSDAGNITINATEFVEIKGRGLANRPSVVTSASRPLDEATRDFLGLFPDFVAGNSGSVSINTPKLRISDGGLINLVSEGLGKSGRVEVNADSIILNNEGGITIETNDDDAGNIQLNTNILQINDGIINASTSGSGEGGDINIDATESVEVNGGGFEKLQQNVINPPLNNQKLTLNSFDNGIVTASEGEGASGNILINTPNFTASDGGLVATTTLTQGSGGDITINAADTLKLDNSLLGTGTFTPLDSGNVNLTARQFTAIGGAQVITNTFAQGRAGNLTVNVSESIDLIDPSAQGFVSGLFATSSQTASGRGKPLRCGGSLRCSKWRNPKGGDIKVTTKDFNIVDGAGVSVSGEGVGDSGNIDIEAVKLFLENSSITAQSVSGEGGNINLSILESLILRNNSTISTQAGTQNSGGGNGGNITINGGLVVAVPEENSDINANAFQGDGGNILINTPGLFGIQFRNQTTPQSDITASSQFGIDGDFNLNLQELDITSGLIELPENLTNAADRIAAGCPTDEEARFVTSGRGGIPQNPKQVLPNEIVLQDLRTFTSSPSSPSSPSTPSQIKEATRWIVNKDGGIEFVADNTQVQQNSKNCQPVK